MRNKIELFKEIQDGEQDFSHIGWEGRGCFAFWTMADGYYNAANILYEKMKDSKGNYAVWDSVFYPMSFCYRHHVELIIKYLYLKYSQCNEEQFKAFLKNGHNIEKLWDNAKGFMEDRLNYLGLDKNNEMKIINSIIHQWCMYDKDSMQMRYPVNKDNKQQNTEKRYDPTNLYVAMRDFYNIICSLDYKLDNQIMVNGITDEEVQDFKKHFFCRLVDIKQMLEIIRPNESDELVGYSTDFFNTSSDEIKEDKIGKVRIKHLSLDELLKRDENDEEQSKRLSINKMDIELKVLIECLFYAGYGEITFPKAEKKAINDLMKLCALRKNIDHFDWVNGGEYFAIEGKQSKSIYNNLHKVLQGCKLL